MSASVASRVRGWCPGALSPMESGDGLIVRVRPRTGALALPSVLAICEAAGLHGSGQIDLTRRANLQIRGVSKATLGPLLHALAEHGLLDATPEAEAVRNVIVPPLSGVDDAEILDMRPIARTLEAATASDARLRTLPAKFGFVLDGGGSLGVDGVRADVRLTAARRGDRAVVEIAADGFEPQSVEPREAAHAAAELAASMRGAVHRVAQRSESIRRDGFPRLGLLSPHRDRWPVGIAAPFGRLDARVLARLAHAASDTGCSDMRLSPWRAVYLVAPMDAAARTLHSLARDLSLIVDDNDPVLRVDACPGAPSCASAGQPTRAAARRLAGMLAGQPAIASVHVSGCRKGCARSSPADLVLVAEGSGFAIIRHGRADAVATSWIDADRLDALAGLLADSAVGARDV